MPLVAVGLSHKTAPVEIRERMAFAEADLAAAAGRIRALGLATEALVVSTCNRVELYAAIPAGDPAALAQQLRGFLLRDRGYTGDASGNRLHPLGNRGIGAFVSSGFRSGFAGAG